MSARRGKGVAKKAKKSIINVMLKLKFDMPKNEKLIIFILALVLSFSLYGNTAGGKFVYDDQLYTDREELRNIGYLDDVFLEPFLPLNPEAGIYRPLVTASFILNYSISGDSPLSFKITNIFLNGAVAFLLFLLVYQLTNNKHLSYITFFIFSFLPIHTEAVAFIKSRDEILSLLFVLLSLLAFIKKRWVLSSLFFLLAILSKEAALVTPLLILYIFISQNGFKFKEILKKSLYYLPSFLIFVLLRFRALGEYAFGKNETLFVYNPLKFVEAGERISTALKTAYLYVQKIILPVNLSANHFYNTIETISTPFKSYQSILGIVIVIIFVYLILKFSKHPIGIGAVIYFLPYLFVSNFVFTTGDIFGERWMYFPSAGFAIIMAHPFHLLIKDRKYKTIGFGALIGLLIFYGALTINRNRVWVSDIALSQNMLKTAPDSVLTRNNWARILFANGHIEEAKKQSEAAINIYPFSPAYDFLGEIYWKEKKYIQAEEYFKKAIDTNPRRPRSYNKLGQMYYEIKKYKETMDILDYPVSFAPNKKNVLMYALSLIKIKEYQKALDIIVKNYGENPLEPKLKLALGLAYFKLGQKEKAEAYLSASKDPSLSEEEFVKFLKEF